MKSMTLDREHLLRRILAVPSSADFCRLRALSLFSWSVEQNARDTQMTTRVTEGARWEEAAVLVSRVSRLLRPTLARACTPLNKSKEKERLLAVYDFCNVEICTLVPTL